MNLSILKPMNSQNVPTVGTKRPNENINENTIKRSKSNHQKKNVAKKMAFNTSLLLSV